MQEAVVASLPTGGSSAAPPGQVPPSDRRRVRSSRTQALILDALVDLVESGRPQPSSRQIAERAGVARRSIFHHFDDMNLVYLEAAELQASRYRSFVTAVPPRGRVEFRTGLLCHQRRELFEAVGPVFRAASARVGGPAGLELHLAALRHLLRRQLAETVAPELAARGRGSGVLLDTLELATSWGHWEALRFEQHHPVPAAERLMAYAAIRLLR